VGRFFQFYSCTARANAGKARTLDQELINLIIKKDLLGLQDYFDAQKILYV
jgi:hypothetical protein